MLYKGIIINYYAFKRHKTNRLYDFAISITLLYYLFEGF